jgi:hypothetical protein
LIVLARRLQGTPAWLRVFTYVAGACAILGPAFFPFYVFELWGLVAGIWGLAAERRGRSPGRKISLRSPKPQNNLGASSK